jgi:hypothetical protein
VNQRERVARAIAFFEATDDIALLHQALADVAPRAKRAVARHLSRGTEENIPAPADLGPAREPAARDEALATLRATDDFALLQVLARSAGRRVEAIEIAASADFPAGARVRVPEARGYPAGRPRLEGVVAGSGTMLTVTLDNGETWEGPPSLAERAGTS